MISHLAKGLLAAVSLSLGVHAQARPASARYTCSAAQDLIVQKSGSGVRVQYAGQIYDLQRHQSSIGDKFISPKAALIIDGSSAVFVADRHIDVGTCFAAVPLASR